METGRCAPTDEMSEICFSKTEYPRGADRLKSLRGGTTQMWGGSTQDYAGRIDFGAYRPVFVRRKHSPAARVFYIFFVFSNARCVLSQCNTRLRLLYLLNKT